MHFIKNRLSLLLISAMLFCNTNLYAWGPEGHAIVGNLALKFVRDDVRKNVLAILGNMSVDTAANWMDIVKSNTDYDFMRSWHYIDFAKGSSYQPSTNDNIINHLTIAYNELSHKKVLCNEQIKFDLLVLMHLMGDLHMPLHTAYDDDLGGNKVIIQYDTMTTHNLHRFWDEDIIRLKNITMNDCLDLYTKENVYEKQLTSKIDYVAWLNENRALLDGIYDFPGFTLSDTYLNKNAVIVKRQLLLAGLRLADILNRLFYTPAAVINTDSLANNFKNGIDIKDAANYVGKKVTVCARVYEVRATTAITQITLGDKFPNNPLTAIIFAKSYANFKRAPADVYNDKNICVTGKVELYKGKPQIIVEDESQITVQ